MAVILMILLPHTSSLASTALETRRSTQFVDRGASQTFSCPLGA